MLIVVPLAVATVCSTVAQDCAKGQMCVADWDAQKRLCPTAGRCEPRPGPVEFELALPIPAGERITCGKGNLVPETSHSACTATTRFAFDLISSAFEAPHLIVASADGQAVVRGGCSSTDLNDQPQGEDRCNDGWGNYVRVQHDASTYTQYAHLSAILVHAGESVRRGQPIGIEGNTGAAGSKHLHWSAHRGDAKVGGPSVPMARVRLAGKTASSDQIICGDWSHGKPTSEAMRLRSETKVIEQPERFGFRATPVQAPLPPRRCGQGLVLLGTDTCVATPPNGREAGVVVFLHGMYSPAGEEQEARVEEELAREALRRGLAFVAPRGRQGLCNWSDDVRASLCWPTGRSQQGDIAEIASALRRTVDDVTKRLGEGTHQRYVMGFSNGGFFASLLLADAPPGTLDGAAILHGGPVLPSTFDKQHPVSTLLIGAEGDPWQGPKMKSLHELLDQAGWHHVYRVRPGAHGLTPEDSRDALDFFARLAKKESVGSR